jgi:hypothetical protein
MITTATTATQAHTTHFTHGNMSELLRTTATTFSASALSTQTPCSIQTKQRSDDQKSWPITVADGAHT